MNERQTGLEDLNFKNLPSSSLRTSISCIVLLYLSSIVNSVFSAQKQQTKQLKVSLHVKNILGKKQPENDQPSHTILLLLFLPLPLFLLWWHFHDLKKLKTKYSVKNVLLGRHLGFFSAVSISQRFPLRSCACQSSFRPKSKMSSLRVLVGVKRVIDYAVKVCSDWETNAWYIILMNDISKFLFSLRRYVWNRIRVAWLLMASSIAWTLLMK